MKLQTIFLGFAASVALCQDVCTNGPDLLDVLQSDPETHEFAQLLAESPDLIANLNPAKRYTVFAPSNAAVVAFRQSFPINGSLASRSNRLGRRSLPDFAAAIALLFTDRSTQAEIHLGPTDLTTNLTDPAFINITPPFVSASLSLGSAFTQSSSNLGLSSSSSVPSTTSSVLSTSSLAELLTTASPSPSNSASRPENTLLPTSNTASPTSSSRQTSSASAIIGCSINTQDVTVQKPVN